jgi:hypothetical protein
MKPGQIRPTCCCTKLPIATTAVCSAGAPCEQCGRDLASLSPDGKAIREIGG